MNARLLSLLFLILLPCALRAQSGAIARPGDTFEFRVAAVPDGEAAAFNGTYTVDDQGMINLPYISQVKVSGLLPNQIQTEIQNRYIEAKIYTHPIITVQSSQPRFVNVMGNVKAPQRVSYTADMTLMSVLTACGGFDDYADKKKVELMRDGKRTIYNTEDIRKGRAQDTSVLPGDQITVRPSIF